MVHDYIQKRDERGEVFEVADVELVKTFYKYLQIFNLSFEENKKKFPLMAYIDPYGNTYFNILQRPDLVKELKVFSKNNNISDVEELIKFIESCGIHEYLVFVGD